MLYAVPAEADTAERTRKGWLSDLLTPAASTLRPLSDFPAEDMPRRLCVECESPLPADLDERQTHLLGVVGLSHSGKSHYLAAALSEATRKRGLRPSGCTEFQADDETAVRLHNYYTQVFRERVLLDTTQAEISLRDQPLTFRVTYDGAAPFLLMTHDISGEVLADHRRRASLTPFLRRASAIVFLVDPLEFDAVRRTLPEHDVPVRRIHQADLLAATLRELEYAPGGQDVPVAVTISKSDLLDRVLPAPRSFSSPPAGEWLDDAVKTSHDVRELLLELGEDELVEIGDKHGQVTYHAVSPLGFSPLDDVAHDPQPRRCLDPLGTVLHRLALALSS